MEKTGKHFKLCFVNQREPGRSYVQSGKPLKFVTPITPKPYARDDFQVPDLEDRVERLKVLGPKDLSESPMTENQKYGWFEMHVDNPSPSLQFGKHTQHMTKENLMNFARIRP